MAPRSPLDFDSSAPPFDAFGNIQPLSPERRGRDSVEHARHQLYIAHDLRTRQRVLIKLASKPGLVYQHDLTNEIATLSTINRELAASPYFPAIYDHGRLRDGRVFLISSLFDEFPLATSIGAERMPARMVAHLRTTIEVAKALTQLHDLEIFHVDLNPMNILHRTEKDRPVIRIIDFESSYERRRHAAGLFYSPPTTPGYAAPEVAYQPPDGRADLFSLGAVLYTLLAGYQWTWESDVRSCIEHDRQLDAELRDMLLTSVEQNPDRRYPSVEHFHVGLAAYLERIWPGRSW